MEKRQWRRKSRRLALKSFFYYLENQEKKDLKSCFNYVLKDLDEREEDKFAWEIVSTAHTNYKKIKLLIRAFAPEYKWEKIASINRVLLILGICEMKFMETPPVVVINEYIELSKTFGEEKSAGFINGVLDNYKKSLGLTREK